MYTGAATCENRLCYGSDRRDWERSREGSSSKKGTRRFGFFIRSHSDSHLEERLDELRRFWGVDPLKGGAARLQAIAGDVTLPNLGMDAATYSRLSSEVTHVVHSAGDVRLNRPIESARKSAVEATRQIVSFARACAGIGTLDKLEFVSTVGVAGDTAGSVAERAFDHQRAFRNSYEAAKAEAETLVLSEIAGGLPATIHRPSMVVGDSKDGTIIRFQVFYYLCEFLSGSRTAGVVPGYRRRSAWTSCRSTTWPARFSLEHAVAKRSGRIFHFCAGPAARARNRRTRQTGSRLLRRKRAAAAIAAIDAIDVTRRSCPS